MRAYVRHPSEFPIELRPGGLEENAGNTQPERLRDIGAGGLCCCSSAPYQEGQRISVRIPVGEPGFEAEGRVAWCRPEGGHYNVGIAFADEALAFSARMVEQVCHIERYHRELLAQGRDVTKQQAALDWIAQHAGDFPR